MLSYPIIPSRPKQNRLQSITQIPYAEVRSHFVTHLCDVFVPASINIQLIFGGIQAKTSRT